MLQGAANDTTSTTRNYEVLQVVLRDATRCYEWYYESLRCNTSRTRRYYEVLKVVLRVTMWYKESFKLQLVAFKKHSPKGHLLKKSLWKFFQDSLETNCDRVLALVTLQTYASSMKCSSLRQPCFMTFNSQAISILKFLIPFSYS